MNDLLTVNDVAAMLSKTPEWVAATARTGTLPSRKIGRSRRFTQADVDLYLERVRTGAQAGVSSARSIAARNRRRAS